jgi:hypothetical protein
VLFFFFFSLGFLFRYASSQSELEEWIDCGFQPLVVLSATAPTKTPGSSSKAARKNDSVGRQKSNNNLLSKGLDLIRHKSSTSKLSPRGGIGALFEN